MKLIKIAQDHYVIADDSEIQEGDLVFNEYQRQIKKFHAGSGIGLCRKITHSTQPLEYSSKIGKYWGRVQPIELSEVKELIGEVDVKKRFWDILNSETSQSRDEMLLEATKHGFKYGYNQALEDNKEKKYTEEDMRKAIEMAREEHCYADDLNGYYWSKVEIIQSLQPKTEWEVEFIDGKLKLK